MDFLLIARAAYEFNASVVGEYHISRLRRSDQLTYWPENYFKVISLIVDDEDKTSSIKFDSSDISFSEAKSSVSLKVEVLKNITGFIPYFYA